MRNHVKKIRAVAELSDGSTVTFDITGGPESEGTGYNILSKTPPTNGERDRTFDAVNGIAEALDHDGITTYEEDDEDD